MNGDDTYRCTAVGIYDKAGKLMRQIAVDADGKLAEPTSLANGERMFAVMTGPQGTMLASMPPLPWNAPPT
jgi:hypothetical protein